jgi:hypothetical protein
MKKLVLMFVVAISAIGSVSYAFDCPLKNLTKSQSLKADGTAFYPANQPAGYQGSATSAQRVSANK